MKFIIEGREDGEDAELKVEVVTGSDFKQVYFAAHRKDFCADWEEIRSLMEHLRLELGEEEC